MHSPAEAEVDADARRAYDPYWTTRPIGRPLECPAEPLRGEDGVAGRDRHALSLSRRPGSPARTCDPLNVWSRDVEWVRLLATGPQRETVRVSATTSARFRAAIVAVAPAVLLAGLSTTRMSRTRPMRRRSLRSRRRHALGAHTPRHRRGVRAGSARVPRHSPLPSGGGRGRWSVLALPFAVMGSALFMIFTGMEFAPLAAAETGGDMEATQSELIPWFIPILATGAITFTLGALGFAMAVTRNRVLSGQLTRLVVGALVVMAAARFVPLGAAHTSSAWPASWRCGRSQPNCGRIRSRDRRDCRDRCLRGSDNTEL